MDSPRSFWMLLVLLAFCVPVFSEEPPVRLWPAQAPGDTKALPPERDVTKPTDERVNGQRVVRISNVSDPTITVFRPERAKNSGTAVIVCPGGGYSILAMDLEGTEVCEWLNSIGVTGVLLKYRVPGREGRKRHEAPLQDAQRAISWVRHHAQELGIDPQRIGVLGFSAGGHLAAVASNQHETRTYSKIDEADEVSCRPDFAVLIYPAALTPRDQTGTLSPEIAVASSRTPPTFVAMTQDDPVRVENAVYYYLALKNAGVKAEMHLYPEGGHGYGLRPIGQTVATWPDRVKEWMAAQGLLGSAPEPGVD